MVKPPAPGVVMAEVPPKLLAAGPAPKLFDGAVLAPKLLIVGWIGVVPNPPAVPNAGIAGAGVTALNAGAAPKAGAPKETPGVGTGAPNEPPFGARVEPNDTDGAGVAPKDTDGAEPNPPAAGVPPNGGAGVDPKVGGAGVDPAPNALFSAGPGVPPKLNWLASAGVADPAPKLGGAGVDPAWNVLFEGAGVAAAPNPNVGAGVELLPCGMVEGPGVWPANGLDPPLDAGVDNPAPNVNEDVPSEALGVTPKLTDGLLSAGLSPGAEDPNLKIGAGGAGVGDGAGAPGAPKVNAGAPGACPAGAPNVKPPDTDGLSVSSSLGALRFVRRESSSCSLEAADADATGGLELLSIVLKTKGLGSVEGTLIPPDGPVL